MGMFGKNTGNTLAAILGSLGDALMMRDGGQPIYTQMRMRRQDAQDDEAAYQRRRTDENSDWYAREEWKADHAPAEKDAFDRALAVAGIDPKSAEGQTLYRQRAITMASPAPNLIGSPETGYKWVQPPPPQMPGSTSKGKSYTDPDTGETYDLIGRNPNDPNAWQKRGGGAGNGAGNFRPY